MNTAVKRIQTEISVITNSKHKDIPENVSIGPTDNIFVWNATIFGAEGTPYFGGNFKLKIDLPHDYPFNPPKVQFITKIFHPNINDMGLICLDILKTQWSPALNLTQVMLSILALMSNPNPDDPFNTIAAKLYKTSQREYLETVQEYIRLYAQDN